MNIVSSLIWKFLERGGVQVTQFIVSIIIARLLVPADYGAVALLMIFISIATVFVQSGLNTALVQKKDADEVDITSVFYYSIGLSAIIYLCLFLCAECIADFYGMPDLIILLRVLALTLFPGALNSLQIAILSKRMMFKKQFYSSMAAAIVSGVMGILMAYNGYGTWALVGQQLSYQIVVCIVLLLLVDWHPKFIFSFNRTKSLLSFGVKLLGARLIDTVYHNLESLIIGKMFSAETLAFCNEGKQFPLTLIDNIDGSVQSVMLPAYSAKQDDLSSVKQLLRKTISLSTYLVFPAMFLLAVSGEPIIYLLLGSKWLNSVPYLQLFCIMAMLFPLQTANLQAINALGRSDVYLKLMTLKRSIGLVLLLVSVFIWYSPFAVIVAALVVEILAILVNVPSNYKILGYSLKEMLCDIVPNLLISVIMGIICYFVLFVIHDMFFALMIQIILGSVSFILLSLVFKSTNLKYIINLIKKNE